MTALPLFEFTNGVSSKSIKMITGRATIPSTPASKLEGCSIIDINYDFTVSFHHGGPIELFIVPASAPRLV